MSTRLQPARVRRSHPRITQCAAWAAKRSSEVDLFDKDLQELVAKGKSQGYLTYDEVNDYLPDEEVNPDKLDNLLIALEEEGIDLVNEPPAKEFYDVAEQVGAGRRRRPRRLVASTKRRPKRRPAAGGRGGQVEQRSDPHVSLADGRDPAAGPGRGNLAGQEDRSHAQAVPPHGDGLQLGHARTRSPRWTRSIAASLPFDRTIKVSLTERLTKEQIMARMPHNLATLEHLCGAEPAGFQPADSIAARRREVQRRGPQAVHSPPPQDAHAGRRVEPAHAAGAGR